MEPRIKRKKKKIIEKEWMKMEGHRTKFQGVKQNTNREQLELVRIRMDDSINKLVQEEKRMSV